MIEKEKEEIRVLNFLVWLQVAIYAADETSNINWFNKKPD